MHKKIAILQSNYIPWKGYFDLINSVDDFVLYDDVQYTKNDWRNRNLIKTPEGLKWMTIPVRQEKLTQHINETKVFDKKWHLKHWQTLQQNYAKAPFFNFYKPVLEELYLNPGSEFLSQINYNFIQVICGLLEIKTRILRSEEITTEGGTTERLINIVKLLDGTEYISGPAARNYLNEALFLNENIKVTWFDYYDYPEYRQLFPPFEHRVSVLDLLFNEGPNAPQFMKSFKK